MAEQLVLLKIKNAEENYEPGSRINIKLWLRRTLVHFELFSALMQSCSN